MILSIPCSSCWPFDALLVNWILGTAFAVLLSGACRLRCPAFRRLLCCICGRRRLLRRLLVTCGIFVSLTAAISVVGALHSLQLAVTLCVAVRRRPLSRSSDPMSGFFCLRKATLARSADAGVNTMGFKIGLELMVRCRCTAVVDVPITFRERVAGESKLSMKQNVEYQRQKASLEEVVSGWPREATARDRDDFILWAVQTAAEERGYDIFSSSETGHNPYLPLVLAAEHTDEIELQTSIALSFSRSPMDTAYIAWDLQNLSNGRFTLGHSS